jgi:hypothetical protein
MSYSFKTFQIHQTLNQNGLLITALPRSSFISYRCFIESVLKSIFYYTRSSIYKQSFSQFYYERVMSENEMDLDKVSRFFESVLYILSHDFSKEMTFVFPTLAKNPSNMYLELIWKLREGFINSIKRDDLHFSSLEGYFTYSNTIDKFFQLIDDYKEIKGEDIHRQMEQIKIGTKEPDNNLTEINTFIAIVCKLYTQFSVYAVKETKEFIPAQRNVNAYVYKCFKEQQEGRGNENTSTDKALKSKADPLSLWTTSKIQISAIAIDQRAKSVNIMKGRVVNKRF